MKEQQLIKGCENGESWAQKQLYERYAPAMLSLCMRYTGNRENARDLLHDGFIKIFTKINTYTGTGSLAGWIRKIFVTTALEFLRANNALRFSVDIEEYVDSIEDINISAFEQLSADDLLACVARLPDGFRVIFNLHVVEGYSHAEIARMLNIQESTSRSQYYRARQILQKSVTYLNTIEPARINIKYVI
ncbi:MAG: sigma-70 family RNA polymerase sigma factor [Prevotellaceae bacterium]|jgi:RNA polymerase sigma-70 factor (ECF subfamily)|nr:sigma-70 family RNA polymerase sigma factor [Prevotellaceae bacterium]